MINTDKPKIMLVDDDPALRESLQLVLKSDFDVSVLPSGEAALEVLCTSTKPELDILLLDVMMPGIDGLELLTQLKRVHPSLPVIMVSASTTVKTAVEAMKIGAVDFLNKPFQIDELTIKINEVISEHATDTVDSYSSIETNVSSTDTVFGDFGRLVGQHPEMKEVYKKVSQVSNKKTTVLITGESGTGKELIARELHLQSDRKDKPFVAINCAAIPETLVESELFGHEKGSFTHAVEKRLGHFEMANGGTIFLDEIGELIPSVQVKLLRVLQEREFFRVGRSKPISVDVRVIAATNKSLEQAVKDGTFRQDLFYRINVVNIELPPLRKRKEDIGRLCDFFLKKLSPFYGGVVPAYTEAFISCLESYAWPGNVRELENVIESIIALSQGEDLSDADVPARIRGTTAPPDNLKDAVVGGFMPFEQAERQFEYEIITRALEKTNNIQTKAAELLGISRRILKYKMDKLGIVYQDEE